MPSTNRPSDAAAEVQARVEAARQQALALLEEDGAAPVVGEPVGYADRSERLEERDLTFPRLKLTQQMSQQAVDGQAKLGDYYLTLEERNLGPAVEIVPLRLKKTRSLFVDGQRLCFSQDLVYGIGDPGDDNRARGIICDDCPLAQFTREGPPRCRLTYNYLLLVRPADQPEAEWVPAVLSLAGSSATAGKALNQMYLQRAYHPDFREWYSSTYRLTGEKRPNKKGGGFYAVARIERLGPTAAEVRQLAQRLVGVRESGNFVQLADQAEEAAAL